MPLPTIEIYASLDCPFAYLATYRLRQLWPEYEGKLEFVWRTLSLEYINERPVQLPLLAAEQPLFTQIEPELPYEPWHAPEWLWPATMWPAAEALGCAQAQGVSAAFAMSWALRHAFFAQSRNTTLRHVLLAIAAEVAAETLLDVARFEADWDSGRYKQSVIADSRRGWHELQLNGSATFLLPGSRRVTNPAVGAVDFDEENYLLRSHQPYEGDPLATYRELLDSVVSAGD